MNAETGLRPAAPDRPPLTRRWRLGDAMAGILAVAAVVLAAAMLPLPATVDRLTLVNPTGYALDVDVTDGAGDGWTPVGTVEQHSSQRVERVLDQGDVWTFRFSAQGADGGVVRLSRTQLRAADWRVDVPPVVGERLAATGATPNP